ncbi:carbohydrate kinase [Corynebacterium variabile]|uniref:Gluconokinase n=1 Tax=Corynebacterium variabile TaxID=1727 RepID=A0A4Y4C1C3_9CORY|nr:carbohydrate kinase [Corynebacterium variabile]GEC86841.1 hypothetical protein CVA01_21550 [Corynebacterium variabile]
MSSKFSPVHVVLSGMNGTGRSGIAEHLSQLTGMPVADAAAFHPATSRRKIASGQVLCTADVTGQLHRMRDWIADRAVSGTSTILTCPPLSRADRDALREAEDVAVLTGQDGSRVMFIGLAAPDATSTDPVAPDEFGTTVDASGHPEDVADRVLDAIARMRSDQQIADGSPSMADRLIAQAREAAEQ